VGIVFRHREAERAFETTKEKGRHHCRPFLNQFDDAISIPGQAERPSEHPS
jgi:hypothetical protein